MTIDDMRYYISQHPRYKGTTVWNKRCATMPDNQVIAIYNKFKNLDYKAIKAEMAESASTTPEEFHQIDMFEYMMGMSEREKHINVLEKTLETYQELLSKEIKEALKYAISSLKTDLKYDLMYEGDILMKEEHNDK